MVSIHSRAVVVENFLHANVRVIDGVLAHGLGCYASETGAREQEGKFAKHKRERKQKLVNTEMIC